VDTTRVLALVATATLLWATPAYAQREDDKARVDADLARTQATLEGATERAQQAAAQYTIANAKLPAAQNLLANARDKLATSKAAAKRADRDSAAAAAAQAQANKGYDEAAAKVEDANAHVTEFVTRTYQGSRFLALNSLLDSGSPSEFATRVGYLDHVAAHERQAVDALTSARLEAKNRSNAAQVARQKADAARDAARRALSESQSAAAVAEQAAADVQNLVHQRQQAAAVADQERGAVLARYNALKAESERIAAELRAAAEQAARAGSRGGGGGPPVVAPPVRGGAFFLMPTRGFKSSDFGQRYDPYYRVWQLHAGTDIAAPMGQAIYAAADGRVVKAGWNGGYGNYTCISHGSYEGRDLATCYAHQSQMMVSPGQSVRRGQVIGRIGSTGASTGAHLHFEVRRAGTPVNPLSWLPGCLC
jgi:murein DD-endopeptidase MepM/ murein hydrolase activator NlpD